MKIINLKTGKVRTHEPPPLPNCEICDVQVDVSKEGVEGEIGRLPVAFCGVCISGIVKILVDNNENKK